MARKFGGRVGAGLVAVSLLAASLVNPASALGAEEIEADLEGRSIPARWISSYFCHDLEFPLIRCFQSASRLEADLGERMSTVALAAVIYVTIYDDTSYGGAYMQVSSDYDALAIVGWNDRVSSYKARNGETGSFYADWYHGGTGHAFCCNSSVPGLGGQNNTFSSIYRT